MRLRLILAGISLLLFAGLASAGQVETVLTANSILYTVAPSTDGLSLELTRRSGDVRESLVVPGTADKALDSDGRLVWDSCSDTLYVAWRRAGDGVDEIRLATLSSAGEWSEPITVTAGNARHLGLQIVLTHARAEGEELEATLLHAAWWSVDGSFEPEYAIVAFEKGEHVSTDVANLEDLAALRDAEGDEFEETGASLHPPLALARDGRAVDVVFGGENTTAVTRVRVEPRKVIGEARIWRPLGKSGVHTGPARVIADSSMPVHSFITKGRIVLYTPEAKFRFTVLDNGKWTPVRMIEVDGDLSSERLIQELHRTVEEQLGAEEQPQTEQ